MILNFSIDKNHAVLYCNRNEAPARAAVQNTQGAGLYLNGFYRIWRNLNMYDIDLNRYTEVVDSAIALRPQIEKAVDEICAQGYSNLFFIGCGGTTPSRCR